MNETLFVKVGDYRVALAHIIEWIYTEPVLPLLTDGPDRDDRIKSGKLEWVADAWAPNMPVDARGAWVWTDTRETFQIHPSTLKLTTTEQFDDAGMRHNYHTVTGDAADILRDQLNRMVIS